MAFIVQSVGQNPHNTRELGAMLGEEFELSHIECADAQLVGRLLIGTRS